MGAPGWISSVKLSPCKPRMTTKRERREKKRCQLAETTSCTSLLCHGNLSLPLSRPQQFTTATLHSSFPSSLLELVPLLLEILLDIWDASSTSKTVSMQLLLSHLAPLYLIPSPPRPPLLRTTPPITLWVM